MEEFQNPDGRYIVTFDGSIDGNLIQIAILVTENAARKVESIRLFARPWPVVKLFRQYMERNLRPDGPRHYLESASNLCVTMDVQSL